MKNRKSHLIYEFYFTINLNSKFINNNNNIIISTFAKSYNINNIYIITQIL